MASGLLVEMSLHVCHESVRCAGDTRVNSPDDRPLAARSPATIAAAARAHAPIPASLSINSPDPHGHARASSAMPVPSASTRAQVVPARAAKRLGAATSPAAASGPATSGSLSFSQPELCNFAGEAPEDQGKEAEEDTEDSEDGLLTDSDDLSSWGSDEEIWGSDSDYHDTDEEEEALAGHHSTGPAVYAMCAVLAAGIL